MRLQKTGLQQLFTQRQFYFPLGLGSFPSKLDLNISGTFIVVHAGYISVFDIDYKKNLSKIVINA